MGSQKKPADHAPVLQTPNPAEDIELVQNAPGRHDFGLKSAHNPAHDIAIRRVHERAMAPLQNAIQQAASCDVTLLLADMEVHPFSAWHAAQPMHLAISLFQNAFGHGAMMMVFPASLISALVEGYYGGKITPIAKSDRSLTRTEKALAARLARVMAAELGHAWRDLATVSLDSVVQYDSLADMDAIAADAEVLVIRCDALFGAKTTAHTIDIVYAVSGIVSEASLGRAPAALGAPCHQQAHAWQDALCNNIAHIRLPVRTVLARPLLSVSQLLSLRVGDILPISMPPAVPFLVKGKRFAMVSIGETAGQAAVRIETLCAFSDTQDFQPDFVEI